MKSFHIGLLTISDTRDEVEDKSGAKLEECISKNELCECVEKTIVIDNIYKIRERISAWIASNTVNVLITTGGTGMTGRDVTPEAILPLLDKQLDGFGEIFRSLSYQVSCNSLSLSNVCRNSARLDCSHACLLAPRMANYCFVYLARLALVLWVGS